VAEKTIEGDESTVPVGFKLGLENLAQPSSFFSHNESKAL
jgi:hypothetical protein